MRFVKKKLKRRREMERQDMIQKFDFTSQPSILVQGAMETETDYLTGQLADAVCVTVGNWKYTTGFLGERRVPVIVSRTYQGMANAAAATALALTHFAPCAVINQGIAGGHAKELHVGDLVVGEKVVPMGAVMQEFRPEGDGIAPLGFTPLFLEIYDKEKAATEKVFAFDCDERMVAAAGTVKTGLRVHKGVLGSADEWNNQIDWIAVMRERYHTAAEDMESAAAAQMCRSFHVPFIGIRIISNSIVNGEEFDESKALFVQKFVADYIAELHGFLG